MYRAVFRALSRAVVETLQNTSFTGVTGTSARTLAAATSAASGTVIATGTAAQTLAAVTSTAEGTV
jgi:hypothetical protein